MGNNLYNISIKYALQSIGGNYIQRENLTLNYLLFHKRLTQGWKFERFGIVTTSI